ncbi:MAG: EamA family transporter [Rhodoglobus sp.]
MEAKWKWMAVTAIAPIAWGATYFVTSEFLPADYPLWGGVIRALPAGILLLAITRRLPRGSWWWKSAVLGTLNVGAFFVLVYLAAQLLPSSIASTLMATSAAVMILLAWPILGDRPRLLSLAGALIGFMGVAVMLANGDAAANGWGIVASLAAMSMSSIGYVLAKRWSTSTPILATTSWQLIAGGLIVAPVAAIVEGAPPALDPPAIGAFAFVSFVATALAFVAWFTGLRHLPAGTVGLIGLLNPVTGVLLGVLIAGEPFGIPQLAGVALVLAGVTLGQRASKPTAR